MTSIPVKLGSEYYRNSLSEQGKIFYDSMFSQLQRKEYTGTSNFPIYNAPTASSDCFAAFQAIRDDHPEFFFLGFQSEFTHTEKFGKLSYPILYSNEVISRIQTQLRKSIYELVRGTAGLPLIEQETLVYQRIAKKMTYINHDDVRDHNIVGPILMGAGVCEGLDSLLRLCFRRIGIPCIKVYGKTQKSSSWHCWTIAWIYGKPVHCDITWDKSSDNIIWYNYLNLSDQQISITHHNFLGKQFPHCETEQYSYYCYHNLCVNSRADLFRRLTQIRRPSASILLHIGYTPQGGNLISEVKKVLCSTGIQGSFSIQAYPDLRNIYITRN